MEVPRSGWLVAVRRDLLVMFLLDYDGSGSMTVDDHDTFFRPPEEFPSQTGG
jgi:hypothetical protein